MFVALVTTLILGSVSYALQSADQVALAATPLGAVRPKFFFDCTQYAALGDSYSAGINADPNGQLPSCTGLNCGINAPYQTTSDCARNNESYPWQFQFVYPPRNVLKCDNFTFIACSGADTTDMKNNQIPAVPADANLITFTIGGNNGNAFASVVKYCVFVRVGRCDSALANATTAINEIDGYLDAVHSKLAAGWPKAIIVALGYAQFWPTTTYTQSNCNSTFLGNVNATRRATMNSLVLSLNGKIQQAAARAGIVYLDYDSVFEQQRLCDINPVSYFQYSLFGLLDEYDGSEKGKDRLDFYNKGVFHPTRGGHSMINNTLSAFIQTQRAQLK